MGDNIIVRTPWLLEKMRSSNPTLSSNECFSTEKGVGQGDISSPLLWIAAFDIPLTALSTVESGFKILDLADLAVAVTDVAYADDVVSMTSSPQALQSKADIMSGWSLLSGVKINTTKLRTFGIS